MIVEERSAVILDLAWHPHGGYLATAGSDGVLKIFADKTTSFDLLTQIQRERSIRRVEWSHDGSFLVTAGFDNTASVYRFDPSSNEPLSFVSSLSGQESELKTARFSPDDKYIVTCSRDKSIWVWSTDDYDNIAIHNEHTADVKDAAFSPDGSIIASVSFDGTTKIWDASEELSSLQTFSDHKGTVWALSFSPEDSSFVTLGEDGKAILYTRNEDGSYKKENEIALQKELQPLYSVTFCDGEWIIAGSERTIFFVDPKMTEIRRQILVHQTGDLNCVRPDPLKSSRIACGNDDGTVVIIEE